MMEATPSAPLVVPETDLLLELLVVALDAPPHFGNVHEPAEADACRHGGEPVFVFAELGFTLGPFDQQPFLCELPRNCTIVPDTHAHTGKTRREPIGRAFPPPDRAPGALG